MTSSAFPSCPTRASDAGYLYAVSCLLQSWERTGKGQLLARLLCLVARAGFHTSSMNHTLRTDPLENV